MDKLTINRNFSKHAASYDGHSYVQRECADKLINLIGNKNCGRILEIGCGTGGYTHLLRTKFPAADIDAVDISPEMVNIARDKTRDMNIRFSVGDGEQIAFSGKYDLVTSNASFQWFQDFGIALGKFEHILSNNGLLCFSMYGPGTFIELSNILTAHYGSPKRLTSDGFLSANEVKRLLKPFFTEVTLEESRISVDFPSLWDLLRDIKNSGARGEGLSPGIFIGKNTLLALEKAYFDKYKRITATHHVYFCRARL